ncbi:MAG: hypothetical protein H0W82_02300 [Actinobacteria bacterium]|nr:hypothetical protein [Actinomycetota bacterium]
MTDAELHEALDGLSAYDMGAVDSGIHDEALRARAIEALHGMDETTCRLFLSRHIREHFLTEDQLAQRYGYEDVNAFFRWLGDYMDFDV